MDAPIEDPSPYIGPDISLPIVSPHVLNDYDK